MDISAVGVTNWSDWVIGKLVGLSFTGAPIKSSTEKFEFVGSVKDSSVIAVGATTSGVMVSFFFTGVRTGLLALNAIEDHYEYTAPLGAHKKN